MDGVEATPEAAFRYLWSCVRGCGYGPNNSCGSWVNRMLNSGEHCALVPTTMHWTARGRAMDAAAHH